MSAQARHIAQAVRNELGPAPGTTIVRAQDVPIGHVFARRHDTRTLLVPLVACGQKANDSKATWAVVIATQHGQEAALGSVVRLEHNESVYRVIVVEPALVSFH